MFIITLLFITNGRLKKNLERSLRSILLKKLPLLLCSLCYNLSSKVLHIMFSCSQPTRVFDKMVPVSVTIHEIQDRVHLHPAGRPLPWGARTFKVWEQRHLNCTEEEEAILWAARLFEWCPQPWPLLTTPWQLLVRPPRLQGTFILHGVIFCSILHRVSPQAALMCLPCPWRPMQCGTHRSGFLSSFFLTWNSVSTKQTTLLHFNSYSSI